MTDNRRCDIAIDIEFLFHDLLETGLRRLFSRHVSFQCRRLHESGQIGNAKGPNTRLNQTSKLNPILITLLSSPLEPLLRKGSKLQNAYQHCHIHIRNPRLNTETNFSLDIFMNDNRNKLNFVIKHFLNAILHYLDSNCIPKS